MTVTFPTILIPARLIAVLLLMLALARLCTGCTVTTGPILSPRVAIQVGGDHSDPDVRVSNALGEGASQEHEMDFDKPVDAPGNLTAPLKP